MRKIEEKMVELVKTRKSGHCGNNTFVSYYEEGNYSCGWLHGNNIAVFNHNTGGKAVNKGTLLCYPTSTTCSRLRALGFDVRVKAGVPYLDGKVVSDV